MAFQTGTATDANDALIKLKNFLGANGYTLNVDTAEGTGVRVTASKGGRFFNFRSYVNETIPNFANQTGIFMNASTAFNGASPWYQQANALTFNDGATKHLLTGINRIGAVTSYHFHQYSNADYDVVYAIFESPAGTFQRLMFGKISTARYGNLWSGTQGMFFNGSVGPHYGGASLTLNFFGSALSSTWGAQNPYSAIYNGTTWMNGCADINPAFFSPAIPQVLDGIAKKSTVFANVPNTFNGLPIGFPVEVFKGLDNLAINSASPISPIGELPNVYWTNIKNLVPATNITYGSDIYRVYPFYKKSDTWNNGNPENGTYYLGFIIKTN